MLKAAWRGLVGWKTRVSSVVGHGLTNVLGIHLFLLRRQKAIPALGHSSTEPLSDIEEDSSSVETTHIMEEDDDAIEVQQQQQQSSRVKIPTKKEWLETACTRLKENDRNLVELEIDPGLYSSLDDLYPADLELLSQALKGNTQVTRLVLHNLLLSQYSTKQLLRAIENSNITSLQLDDTRGDGTAVVALSLQNTERKRKKGHSIPLPHFSNLRHQARPLHQGECENSWLSVRLPQHLTELRICHTRLTFEDVSALSLGLIRASCSITKLDLQATGLTDSCMQRLCEGLVSNHSVTKLCLDFNNTLGDKGMKYLSEMLKHNDSIEELHLFGNNVSAKGACYLGRRALPHNTTLKKLILSFNNIRDKGAAYLAEGLTRNTTLATLWLPSNQVGNEGIKAFAKYLPQMKGLIQLNIGDHFTEEATKVMIEGLKHNTSLRDLYLESALVLCLEDEQSSPLDQEIEFYLRLNAATAGRQCFRAEHPAQPTTSCVGDYGYASHQESVPTEPMHPGLWGNILEKAQKHSSDRDRPDVLYYLLRNKPELLLQPPSLSL